MDKYRAERQAGTDLTLPTVPVVWESIQQREIQSQEPPAVPDLLDGIFPVTRTSCYAWQISRYAYGGTSPWIYYSVGLCLNIADGARWHDAVSLITSQSLLTFTVSKPS